MFSVKVNSKNFTISLFLIPLILSIGLAPAIPFVSAQSEPAQCSDGLVLVKRYSDDTTHCLDSLTATIWDTYGTGKIIESETEEKPQQNVTPVSKPKTNSKPKSTKCQKNSRYMYIVLPVQEAGWLPTSWKEMVLRKYIIFQEV